MCARDGGCARVWVRVCSHLIMAISNFLRAVAMEAAFEVKRSTESWHYLRPLARTSEGTGEHVVHRQRRLAPFAMA